LERSTKDVSDNGKHAVHFSSRKIACNIETAQNSSKQLDQINTFGFSELDGDHSLGQGQSHLPLKLDLQKRPTFQPKTASAPLCGGMELSIQPQD